MLTRNERASPSFPGDESEPGDPDEGDNDDSVGEPGDVHDGVLHPVRPVRRSSVDLGHGLTLRTCSVPSPTRRARGAGHVIAREAVFESRVVVVASSSVVRLGSSGTTPNTPTRRK